MSQRSLSRKAFPDYIIEKIGYYVYRLEDPRNGKTFYVGKGVGNRVFQHVAEAVKDSERVTLKLDRIRDIEADNVRVRHVIHRHGLTEKEAYEVEASLIDAYNVQDDGLTNIQGGYQNGERGQMGVDDVIALHLAEPIEIQIPMLLVNLRRQFEHGLTAEQLYARSRGGWELQPKRHIRVKHAMAIAFGIIREVYRLERWERFDTRSQPKNPLRKDVNLTAKSVFRWRFDGAPDQELRDRYIGRAITLELRGQNPISWVDLDTIDEGPGPRTIISQ
jgi:hypothetical protein